MKKLIFSYLTTLSRGESSQTILLASVGRSGTTWLGNILSALDGYKMLNEPLRPENPTEYEARYRHRPYVEENEVAPCLKEKLENAFTGQVPRSYKWDFRSQGRIGILLEHIWNRNVVVKSTRSLRLLPWIHRTFDLKGTVILIRHPCAVVSSMLKSGGWGYDRLEQNGVSTFDQAVGEQAPASISERLRSDIEGTSTNPEILAHMWALDYHVALNHHENTERQYSHLVTYEHLLTEGRRCIRDLCTFLGEEPTEEMRAQLNRPSRTASDQLSTEDTTRQLRKWRDHLDEKTVDRVLSIVHSYDIDMYGPDPMPAPQE
ncbi:hypothetical protein GGP50_002657 [Salinibacter ruber]|uniref:sulfotransferase n=1 Tax=Salinibacter ruber TaxID=146919 RepID=UPI002168D7FA|nr:sulfotransferase [Salinibacter ruber]MCS4194431.1 hypothetical protein [Salinibacter ruber]